MKLGQIISYAVLVSILSPGVQAGSAGKCTISGPRYWLKSDTVDWSIKIGSGQSCIGDLGFRNVAIESASLAQGNPASGTGIVGTTSRSWRPSRCTSKHPASTQQTARGRCRVRRY